MRYRNSLRALAAISLTTASLALSASAQVAAPASAPRAAGTVSATTADGLTLTTTTGQTYTITIPASAKILVVAPGSKDLSSATPGTLTDVVPTDKVIVTGTSGDSGMNLTAVRVILMKSQAIADTHAAEDAAWTRGSGGIVRSIDTSAGSITIAAGLKTLTVTLTPSTIIRRYSGDSVRFADAQVSNLAAIKPGDQLRVRGTKSADGMTIAADELVTGSFHNYAGLIAAINPTAATVTLKDLTTKKSITVVVTSSSDVRRLPPALAQRVALGVKGGASPTSADAAPKPSPTTDASTNTRRAGMDLSAMLSRLPTETLGGLKAGDAVMIVASSPASDASNPTAITLLVGVDAILSASPSGQTMTLSPWSLGGESGEAGGAGASSQHVAPQP